MKKLLFIILSSVFILTIPNVVNASTTQFGSFQTTNKTFPTNSNEIYFDILNLPHDISYGNGIFSYTVLFTQDYSLAPYEFDIFYHSWNYSSCTVSNFFVDNTPSSASSGYQVVSVSCPVFINPSDWPHSIRIKRNGTSSSAESITISDKWTYQSVDIDISSITTSQQQTTNAINGVNDSINNDSVSTNTENSSTASSWASNNASDSVVSDMVLMPITLLNAFSNGFNGTCQSYNLGSLYGTDLTLPCINISNYLGATLWGIIDVLMSGFLIYGIGKKFVRVFNDFTNLKDSQVDELYGGGNE